MTAIAYSFSVYNPTTDTWVTGLNPALVAGSFKLVPAMTVVSSPSVTIAGDGFGGYIVTYDRYTNGQATAWLDVDSSNSLGLTNAVRFRYLDFTDAAPIQSQDKVGFALTSGEHTAITADAVAAFVSQGVTTARAAKLDQLDAAVSSRMATFSLPANFSTLSISNAGLVTYANTPPGSSELLDELLSGHKTAGTVGAALSQLTDALVESYAGVGTPPTMPQVLFALLSLLSNVGQVGNVVTAYGLDGTTPKMTFTLDRPAPSQRRRAT